MIPVLCVQDNSNYFKIPGLDLYDKNRNAYNYNSCYPVIAHPPCQQWSKLKAFAVNDKAEKELAYFCFELVNKNGGIMEHPKGSSFFKHVSARQKYMSVVWQSWFGFPAKKETLLYVKDCQLLPTPLSFDLIEKKVERMSKDKRSLMPLSFCQYLVDSLKTHDFYLAVRQTAV